jgi:phenylalanine-4-hydroxylase
MNARELTPSSSPGHHAGGAAALVHLDPDHPGFRDPVYRERRNTIARIALEHQTGTPVAHAPYSDAEHAVWAEVCTALAPLHRARACTEILQLQEILPLHRQAVPQLAELNPRLHAVAGFRMEPVAGMVSARTFLTLVHPGIAELNRVVGEAAMAADGLSMERLERVYWYTLEFGLVAEGSDVKAFGAGLLSSVGELDRCTRQADLRPWDLEAIARTPYDPTGFQEVLFVAPSFTRMLCDVTAWVRTGGHHPAPGSDGTL